MSSLIVDDSNCRNRGSHIEAYCIALNSSLIDFSEALHSIRNEAVKEGELADALDAFMECIDVLMDELKTIGNTIDERADNYIESIDEADQELY